MRSRSPYSRRASMGLSARNPAHPTSHGVVTEFGWQLIAILGALFLVLGLWDVAITWYPLQVGNLEWEFGTISEFFDFLPLLGLGLTLTLCAGLARGARWVVRLAATGLILVTGMILLAAVLYATDLPAALSAMTNQSQMTILKKAIAKSTGQAILYPIGFLWVAVAGLGRLPSPRPLEGHRSGGGGNG